MIRHLVSLALLFCLFLGSVGAQERPVTAYDTSYRASPSISARLQREFLTELRWSAGAEVRDRFAQAFEERSPSQIWQELVAADGLSTGNVADALTAYWVLNWVTANAAYSTRVDSAPVKRQLELAFSADAKFKTTTDQQRQELAEGYILDFLVQHAALNEAVERKDVRSLNQLANAAVRRFRQDMGVNLLALVPGPNGFQSRPAD
jgi:hypothetical protein